MDCLEVLKYQGGYNPEVEMIFVHRRREEHSHQRQQGNFQLNGHSLQTAALTQFAEKK